MSSVNNHSQGNERVDVFNRSGSYFSSGVMQGLFIAMRAPGAKIAQKCCGSYSEAVPVPCHTMMPMPMMQHHAHTATSFRSCPPRWVALWLPPYSFIQNQNQIEILRAKMIGPGRELNPGPPPDDKKALRRNHTTRPPGQ